LFSVWWDRRFVYEHDPVQRALTTPWGEAAARAGDVQRMQAWAGQAAALARPEPAGEIVRRLWDEAQALLPG
jgi:nitronate monooxygenase